jgi:DICT domain-containing protein/nitrogen-specific signal transduction histidine kinase
MNQSTSLLQDLLQSVPNLKVQIYFKTTLTALSHAMEDLILTGDDRPLVIANFQQERFYRQETRRYQRIAEKTDHVYILAMPETDLATIPAPYATIGLESMDELTHEWHLVIVGATYSACLICREHSAVNAVAIDSGRQFSGFWTFDPIVCRQAAQALLGRVVRYRPDLADQVEDARAQYQLEDFVMGGSEPSMARSMVSEVDVRQFSDRLVTYLQASQYRQVQSYRRMMAQAQQAQLINVITAKIRQSLKPDDVVTVAMLEIGQVFTNCVCQMSRLPSMSMLGSHPLFRSLLDQGKMVTIADVSQDSGIQAYPDLQQNMQADQIQACLLVPIVYQQECLAVLELHHGYPRFWTEGDREFLAEIATQVGWGLKQAEAYVSLARLNEQLSSIEQTQNNLIAIVGHELRTPLSTIQVCLESLATEPEMPPDCQQVMLEIALADSERLRKLVQDFLLLSQLESDQISWQVEPIAISDLISLTLSNLRSGSLSIDLPIVMLEIPDDLPMVLGDGEAIMQLLMKLLDNALRFTPKTGTVSVKVYEMAGQLEIQISDTGCGIESSRLDSIFDRFYQEEGFLQRSIGGTGLGLAISRQLVRRLEGKLWATSAGKGKGSQFFVTLPLDDLANLQDLEMLVG